MKTLAVNVVVPTYFSESCGGKTNARLQFVDADRDLALLQSDGVHKQIEPILLTDEPTRYGNEVFLLTFFDMDETNRGMSRNISWRDNVMELQRIEITIFLLVHSPKLFNFCSLHKL